MKQNKFKKSILIKQRELTDCGAAALASVAAFYNLIIPVSKIRQLAGTNKMGTTVLGITKAADKLGLEAKAVEGTTDALNKVPLPSIVHVVTDNGLDHYIVLYKVTPKYFKVMDPAVGRIETYTIEKFNETWSGVLILLLPKVSFEPKNEKVSFPNRLLSLVKPHGFSLILAFLGSAIYTLLSLATALYIRKIVDDALPDGNLKMLHVLGIIMIIILCVQVAMNALKSLIILRVCQKIDSYLITEYYSHLMKLPQQFFDSMRVGELIGRVNDAIKVRVFVNELAIEIVINSLIVIFSVAFMLSIYWRLGLLLIIVIPIFIGIYWISNYFNKKVERRIMEQSAEFESHLVESIGSIKTIKSFGLETISKNKAKTRLDNLLNNVFKSGKNSLFASTATETASFLFTIVLLWLGAIIVISKDLTLGELMSTYALIGFFVTPASNLIKVNQSYQNASIAADRLFEIIDIDVKSENTNYNFASEDVGNIVFENVTFGYNNQEYVFDKLSFEVEKGSIATIVGNSGSGKSTIAHILKKMYPIESGKLLIGSTSIEDINSDYLNKIVSIVPQHVQLFTGTILENITFEELNPNMERVANLIDMLGLRRFVDNLPQGLDTYLIENGINLSGGQRQRLAILRALYINPEIIIFDEATSSLDIESESKIVDIMLMLKDLGKTVISISHRIPVLTVSDQILVLDKGRLAGSGKHDSLFENCEVYRRNWEYHMSYVSKS
jgi:ABC-type bacteriocin transporter